MNRGAGASQAVLGVAYAAHLALGVVLTVWLGRELDAAAFGFFALVAAGLAFARDATDLGTTVAAGRDMAREPARTPLLLQGLLLLRSLPSLALAVAAGVLALLEDDGARRAVLGAATLVMLGMGASAFHAVFHARQQQGPPAAVTVVAQAVLVLACVAGLEAGLAPWWPSLAAVLKEAVALALLAWIGVRALGRSWWVAPPGVALRAALAGVGWWALAALVRHVYAQIDLAAVAALRGQAEAGAYAAASRLLSPALALPWLLTAPLVPLLAVADATRAEAARRLLRHTLLLGTSLAAVLATATSAAAGAVVSLLYDGRYDPPASPAVPVLQWLALSVPALVVVACCSAALLAARAERLALAAVLGGLVCKSGLLLALVPQGGALAAVQVVFAVELLLALVLLFMVRRELLEGLDRSTLRAGAALLVPPLLPLVAGWAARGLSHGPLVAAVCVAAMAAVAWILRSHLGRGYGGDLRSATVQP